MTKEELYKFIKDHPWIDGDGEWTSNGDYYGYTIHQVGDKLYQLMLYDNGGGYREYNKKYIAGRGYCDEYEGPVEVKRIEYVSYAYEPVDDEDES
jgi:hypothetical protein